MANPNFVKKLSETSKTTFAVGRCDHANLTSLQVPEKRAGSSEKASGEPSAPAVRGPRSARRGPTSPHKRYSAHWFVLTLPSAADIGSQACWASFRAAAPEVRLPGALSLLMQVQERLSHLRGFLVAVCASKPGTSAETDPFAATEEEPEWSGQPLRVDEPDVDGNLLVSSPIFTVM
jgi:hypothetical protein